MANVFINGVLREITAEEEAEITTKLAEAAKQNTDPTEVMEKALNVLGVITREE